MPVREDWNLNSLALTLGLKEELVELALTHPANRRMAWLGELSLAEGEHYLVPEQLGRRGVRLIGIDESSVRTKSSVVSDDIHRRSQESEYRSASHTKRSFPFISIRVFGST